MPPSLRKELDKDSTHGKLVDEIERIKVQIRAKVEHPFRLIKRQFGHVKVRYRGLAKNTAAPHAVCAFQPVDGASAFCWRP